MAFVFLTHWYFSTGNERSVDSGPRCDATCNLVASWFALWHYACRPTVENVVCKDVGIKWSVVLDAEISISWRHWTPKN